METTVVALEDGRFRASASRRRIRHQLGCEERVFPVARMRSARGVPSRQLCGRCRDLSLADALPSRLAATDQD